MPNERYSSKYRVTDLPLRKINHRVKMIEANAGESEAQHADEDALMVDFIAYLACSADKITVDLLMRKAKAVLKTRDLPFDRWCG